MTARSTLGARTTTAIRFPPDLRSRLEEEGARRDVSINQLVVWACERALHRWEAQDLDALLCAKAVISGLDR